MKLSTLEDVTGLVSETSDRRMTFHTITFCLERISSNPMEWRLILVQSMEKEEDERTRERERGEWRGMSKERRRIDWEEKRAAWHLRHRINSLNRCDIIIKLAVGSLFSPGPSRVLLPNTKPLAILQASFQTLTEMMTGTQRGGEKKKIRLELYKNPLETILLHEYHYSWFSSIPLSLTRWLLLDTYIFYFPWHWKEPGCPLQHLWIAHLSQQLSRSTF